MSDMVSRVREYVRQWNMIERGDTVIAGVSGGADSVCLLLVLSELSWEMDFVLEAVHVEHGIRGDASLADAAFVIKLCEQRKIRCTVRHMRVPEYSREHRIGEEEAARILRYRAFREAASSVRSEKKSAAAEIKIALAHHMEDNAETMLFQMVRGTGLDGLCGMRPVYRKAQGVTYIRPLLSQAREDVENYLSELGQAYCLDETNLETRYSRNRIRHRVMPELLEVNARAVLHMNQAAERMGKLRDFVERAAGDAYADIVTREDNRCLRIDVNRLRELHEAVAERVIHGALSEFAGAKKDITAAHIEAVLGLADRQTGRLVNLPGGIVAGREYGGICLRRADASPKDASPKDTACAVEPFFVTGELLGECLATGEAISVAVGESGAYLAMSVFPYDGDSTKISSNIYTKWFDYDMIKNGFSVRTREGGDYFVLNDGHRRKLSDYFIDEKIPASDRDGIPLLAKDSEVLWIVGGRMGKSAMVTERTGTILEITYRKEKGKRDGLQ